MLLSEEIFINSSRLLNRKSIKARHNWMYFFQQLNNANIIFVLFKINSNLRLALCIIKSKRLPSYKIGHEVFSKTWVISKFHNFLIFISFASFYRTLLILNNDHFGLELLFSLTFFGGSNIKTCLRCHLWS